MRTLVASILLAAAVALPCRASDPAAGIVPRFARDANPIAITGDARPTRYLEASGRRAAFIGREDGSFEAWAYPLKILHDFHLSFGIAAYADPIPGASLVSTVHIRPEAATVRYSHAAFTVDATWLVPLDLAGGLVLLDVTTTEPLTVYVKFRPDLKPMWPAALGGQYSYWDDTLKAYVIGEGSGKSAALVGSPLGLTPPEQPAHNLPDAPSQFAIRITPEMAARGLVPIVITASVEKLDAAKKIYQALLVSPEALYHESAAHYRRLREEMTSIESPDKQFDLAFEWGKVALDKGLVCNPHLGCGLIAGLGPSGTTERPGFGWFFGGDAFINAWAISAYGDLDTVRQSLEFLRKRQRADGKMMHELSQGAGFIHWFEDYPYGYYHADTTPLYIVAVRDYVRASGDEAFAKDFWPSIRKAYDYCVSTDEDGDGLMDNTRAGLAAVETGALRSRDVLTDVFLGSVWTEAAGAMADLAKVADPSFEAVAQAAAHKARTALNRRFLDDAGRRINFAVMKDGRGQAEQTVWPAFGIWRGVFDQNRPAVEGTLDELARAGLGTDWGARMLSKESTLYQPLSYNNGASWPFLTGWAALALYKGGRSDAAWQYVEALSELTFLEGRGYVPELFSGDLLRSMDAAVPHQLFATAGFVTGVMRGLVGLEETDGGLRLAPHLPPEWNVLRVKNLRWRGHRGDVEIRRNADGEVTFEFTDRAGSCLPVSFDPPMPPGADGMRVWGGDDSCSTGQSVQRPGASVNAGITLIPEQQPLRLGDSPRRLRVIDARLDGNVYTARLQGLRGWTYRVRLDVPFTVESIEGGRQARHEGRIWILEITVPDGPSEWVDCAVRLRVGSRLK